MLTIRTMLNFIRFDPMSFMVYSGVCSWFEIRTKDYWAQHTLKEKKNAFEINYFVLE